MKQIIILLTCCQFSLFTFAPWALADAAPNPEKAAVEAFEKATGELDEAAMKIDDRANRPIGWFSNWMERYRAERNRGSVAIEELWRSLHPTLSPDEQKQPEFKLAHEKAMAARKANSAWADARAKAEAVAKEAVTAEARRQLNAELGKMDFTELRKRVDEYALYGENQPLKRESVTRSSEYNRELFERDLSALDRLSAAENSPNSSDLVSYFSVYSSNLVKLGLRTEDLSKRRALLALVFETRERAAREGLIKDILTDAEFAKVLSRIDELRKVSRVLGALRNLNSRSEPAWATSYQKMIVHGQVGKFHEALWAARELSQGILAAGSEFPVEISVKVKKLEEELEKKVAASEAARILRYSTAIDGVADADSLLTLASTFHGEMKLERTSATQYDSVLASVPELVSVLNGLAGNWKALEMPASRQRGGTLWEAGYEKLRQKIARDVMANRWGYKELTAAPLDALPFSDAVAKLSESLGKKGDWKAALEVAETGQAHGAAGTLNTAAVTAIKEYLKGVQYEAATEIELAVESFRVVVSTVADGIPVAEAAQKLKVLREKYPDAFRQPVRADVQAK